MRQSDRRLLGQRNREWGQICEQLAADYFLKEGYTIRERNWRIGGKLEIDLILEKDRTIIFVEVKARKSGTQDPIDAVNRSKKQRLINAADVYLRRLTLLYEYRFDIVAVTGDMTKYELAHYPDAFLPQPKGRR